MSIKIPENLKGLSDSEVKKAQQQYGDNAIKGCLLYTSDAADE